MLFLCSLILCLCFLAVGASAATTHTVVAGDSMWRIAVRYEVGLSELKEANPKIVNPALIYPGQVITIPEVDAAALRYEQEVIRLVNEIRAQNGLRPLAYDWQLARVARYKSEDMRANRYFSHTSPVYGSPFQMIRNFGITYRSAGENIAKGYTSPQAVVNGWMNSAGHRANILNASFTHIGVGYAGGGNYWTQMFISTSPF
ncbi:MAG: SafA/ExsA family spore coat assembly protein [Ruminococcaceae bacterium]|nr:SafA/ExsA family spore coat assembly protein [Oscillospiraceae bacterium]